MKVITIQHQSVFSTLKTNGIYIADYNRVPDNRVKSYQCMQKFYGWETCPVFGCEIGEHAAIQDGKYIDGVALQLDIPRGIARRQYYYDWADLIYFTEFPEEFADTFDLTKVPDLKTYAERVFRFENQGSYNIVQVTMPFIKMDWVTAVSQKPLAVIEKCQYNPVLQKLMDYDPSATVFSYKTSIFN